MLHLLLTTAGEGASSPFLIVLLVVLFMIILCVPWCLICFFMGKRKNLSFATTFWGLLFWFGVIVVASQPAKYVQCKNCGYKFNPKKTLTCPICKTNIKKSEQNQSEDLESDSN